MGLRGVSIIVVEDAPDVLSVFTTCSVSKAPMPSGPRTESTCWRSLASIASTLVVVDLGLPDIPGEVLIRAIIAAARCPLTVIVITGEHGSSVTRARDAGASAIFVKPCEWGHVLRYLNGLNLVAAA
jgi:DNA-binding response OmpR family regulator